eukprot:6260588-Pyramimonas_sp.AAC.1
MCARGAADNVRTRGSRFAQARQPMHCRRLSSVVHTRCRVLRRAVAIWQRINLPLATNNALKRDMQWNRHVAPAPTSMHLCPPES